MTDPSDGGGSLETPVLKNSFKNKSASGKRRFRPLGARHNAKFTYSDFVPPDPFQTTTFKAVPDRLIDGIVMYSSNFQMYLKGGTIDCLVYRLTHKSTSVADIKAFLLGYRATMTPRAFLERLFMRFNIDYPKSKEEMLPYELTEYNHEVATIRLKIIKVLKLWITNHWTDFSDRLVARLDSNIRSTFLLEKDYEALGLTLLNLLVQKEKDSSKNLVPYIMASGPIPVIIQPSSDNFSDFDPLEVARQLTLYIQALFRAIPDTDFIHHKWYKIPDQCPNLINLIKFCSGLKEWVATEILREKETADRVKVMMKFLEISNFCLQMKNFIGCYDIFSAMYDPAIWRMRATWNKVEKQKLYWDMYFTIRYDLDRLSHYSNYWTKQLPPPVIPDDMEEADLVMGPSQPTKVVPCVPSLGLLLHELVQVEIEEPDYLTVTEQRNDVVNFLKLKKQYDIIRKIVPYKSVTYPFAKVDLIYNYFTSGLKYDNLDVRMSTSRVLEPKDRDFPSGKEIPAVVPLPVDGPAAFGKKMEGFEPAAKHWRTSVVPTPKNNTNTNTPTLGGAVRPTMILPPPPKVSNKQGTVFEPEKNTLRKKRTVRIPDLSSVTATDSGGINNDMITIRAGFYERPEKLSPAGIIIYTSFLKGGTLEGILLSLLRNNTAEKDIKAFLIGRDRKKITTVDLLMKLTVLWETPPRLEVLTILEDDVVAVEPETQIPENNPKTPENNSKTPENNSKTPENSSKTPENNSKTPENLDIPVNIPPIPEIPVNIPPVPEIPANIPPIPEIMVIPADIQIPEVTQTQVDIHIPTPVGQPESVSLDIVEKGLSPLEDSLSDDSDSESSEESKQNPLTKSGKKEARRIRKAHAIIHENIGKFILTWLTFQFNDFSSDSETLAKLRTFLKVTIFLGDSTTIAREITSLIQTNLKNIKEEFELKKEKHDKKENKKPESEDAEFLLREFDLDGLSKQIAAYQQKLFGAIEPIELINNPWTNDLENCPHLLKFIQFTEALTSTVIFDILSAQNLKDQVLLLKHFMLLALKSRDLNNFSCCMSIARALLGKPVRTLIELWERFATVEVDTFAAFNKVVAEFAPTANFKTYRKILASCKGPFVPYLTVHLTDLAFEASASEHLAVTTGVSGVLNFRKFVLQYEILEEIKRAQKSKKYEFHRVRTIWSFLKYYLKEQSLDPALIPPEDPQIEEDLPDEINDKEQNSLKAKICSNEDVDSNGEKIDDHVEEEDIPTWTKLPKTVRRKCKKLKIPKEDMKKNIETLWTVCEFLLPEDMPPRKRKKVRRPYATEDQRKEAEKELLQAKKLKKIYKKMTYRGRGGFATVMSARDTTRKNELIAIKKLAHETPRQQENNFSEIAFLRLCVNHNNIVQYQKAWYIPDDKELWMIMEYLEGGTLHEAAHNHKFSENHIAYVGREVLKALKFLHSKELVHRDLKSQNIMLSMNGVVKLIDFGLCAELSCGPRDSLVGSPFWMPPEMIKRQTHSYNVDIWSLGVCLLELYLMDPPHTTSGVKCMFMTATVGLQDQIPETAQAPAKTFLKRCLEMDPKKRPGSAELVEDPFVNRPGLSKGITDVLKDIFLTNTMTVLGLDF